MRPACPTCGKKIAWKHMSSDFKCPSCGTRLTSNYWTVMIWVTLLTPLPVIGMGDAAAIIVGLIAGIGLCLLLMASLITVKVFDEKDAT